MVRGACRPAADEPECVVLRPRLCDRAALGTAEGRERLGAFFRAAPPVPATVSVDEHADLLAKFVRCALAEVCPAAPRQPSKPWISPDTWRRIERRSAVRVQFFRTRRAARRRELAFWWVCWRGGLAAAGSQPWALAQERAELHALAVATRFLTQETYGIRANAKDDYCRFAGETASRAARAAEHGDSATVCRCARSLQRRPPRQSVRITLDGGATAVTKAQAQTWWQGHFAAQLGGTVRTREDLAALAVEVLDDPGLLQHKAGVPRTFAPSIDGVLDCINRLHAGRVHGGDVIPKEALLDQVPQPGLDSL